MGRWRATVGRKQLGIRHIPAYSPEARGPLAAYVRGAPRSPGQGTRRRRDRNHRGGEPVPQRHLLAGAQSSFTPSRRPSRVPPSCPGSAGILPRSSAIRRTASSATTIPSSSSGCASPVARALRQGHRPGPRVRRLHHRHLLRAALHRPLSTRWSAPGSATQGRVTRFHAAALSRGMPRLKARTKRTTDLLPKPDNLACWRQMGRV
jgi:hypothetical protein